MSKYYKAEDVIAFLNLHCPKDMWEYQIADLPTIEVSKDCISRADLIQDLRKDAERVEMEEFANDTVWRTIGNAPSVIPKAKEGEWIEDEYGIPHCSECNCINNTVYRNYCPNCGSRNRKVVVADTPQTDCDTNCTE